MDFQPMTSRKEQSHLSFFTSVWPALLWLSCSPVSVTLCFLNNGLQARSAALMCICKIYGKTHHQSISGPQALGKEHIPAGLLTGLPTSGWKRKHKRNGSSKSCATLVWFPALIFTFLYQKCSGPSTAKEWKATDYLLKLMLLGLLLFCRNMGNSLGIYYGKHLSSLQAETWTSLCTLEQAFSVLKYIHWKSHILPKYRKSWL